MNVKMCRTEKKKLHNAVASAIETVSQLAANYYRNDKYVDFSTRASPAGNKLITR